MEESILLLAYGFRDNEFLRTCFSEYNTIDVLVVSLLITEVLGLCAQYFKK